jgi:lycopene cyclase domain-containing protein
MTYTALAAALVAASLVAALAGARRLPDARARGRHWAAVGVVAVMLLILTAVFDNVMIAAGLYEFGVNSTIGITLGLVPIEDFSYTLACALGIPGVWLLATTPAPRGRDG